MEPLLKTFKRILSLKFIARLLFSVTVLVWLSFNQNYFSDLIDVFDRLSLFSTISIVLLFNLSQIVSSERARALLSKLAVRPSFLRGLDIYYRGMVVNFFVPGGVGGDVCKVIEYQNEQKSTGKIEIAKFLILERLSGLIIILSMTLLFLAFNQIQYESIYFDWRYKTLFVFGSLLTSWLGFYFLKKQFDSYSISLRLLAFSFVVQILQIGCLYSFLWGLNAQVHAAGLTLIFLTSSLVAVLPLSFGGLGMRELTFATLSPLINIDSSLGVGFSSVFFLTSLFSSVLGSQAMNLFSGIKEESMIVSN